MFVFYMIIPPILLYLAHPNSIQPPTLLLRCPIFSF